MDQTGLDRRTANFQPLTPLSFLPRAAVAHPNHLAVVHGAIRRTYPDLLDRCVRLAGALAGIGIGRGDVVAALLPNVPAMLECHYGVPMTGAVLNTINIRLDADTVGYILDHGEAKAVIVDPEFLPLLQAALGLCANRPRIIVARDSEAAGQATQDDYEAMLAAADPGFAWSMPADEWDPIALNYTSGSTGRPKGVVYHHRGAYLLAIGNILAAAMPKQPTYLWTLPMFHCNGWCHPWTLVAASGTQVCLRAVRGPAMWQLIAEERVTNLCGAPIVMSTLLDTPAEQKRPLTGPVTFMTAGAPPPESVLARMRAAGFTVSHTYGLTETYGPSVVNEWRDEWSTLDAPAQAAMTARQGVRYVPLEALEVRDPETMAPVPADGTTLGEVMFRGNVVMKGYLKDPSATEKAFADGWFHSGDLGVRHADGTIQLRDRSKDIIISGGENVSSIEVEDALYRHPAVALAAVVAQPDEKWGEVPCAFIELKPGAAATEAELIGFVRERLAGFKSPKRIVFADLPRTSTGKIQKYLLRARLRAEA